MTPGLRKGNITSFSYASAKKMRKKTRIQNLQGEINLWKDTVNRLASALVILRKQLDKFGAQEAWLSEEEDAFEGGKGHTNYIWNGEEDPTKQIQATLAQVQEKLGPLSRMFSAQPEAKHDATNSGEQAGSEGGELPVEAAVAAS